MGQVVIFTLVTLSYIWLVAIPTGQHNTAQKSATEQTSLLYILLPVKLELLHLLLPNFADTKINKDLCYLYPKRRGNCVFVVFMLGKQTCLPNE